MSPYTRAVVPITLTGDTGRTPREAQTGTGAGDVAAGDVAAGGAGAGEVPDGAEPDREAVATGHRRPPPPVHPAQTHAAIRAATIPDKPRIAAR